MGALYMKFANREFYPMVEQKVLHGPHIFMHISITQSFYFIIYSMIEIK